MTFRLARPAIAEIEAILEHVRMESPAGAAALGARLEEVFDMIAGFPSSGRSTSRKGMRYANTHPYPYLIFYKTSPSLTEIVAVRHGARNPKSMPAHPR